MSHSVDAEKGPAAVKRPASDLNSECVPNSFNLKVHAIWAAAKNALRAKYLVNCHPSLHARHAKLGTNRYGQALKRDFDAIATGRPA